MKAISVKQPWASMIAQGEKTIETRTWPTKHRGDLLIVSSKRPTFPGLPTGKALCVVRLFDCHPMTADDESEARCSCYDGAWAWCLDHRRWIMPFAVKGALSFYEVADGLIYF